MAWRGDSCRVCVGDYGEDLSRGWYEAANTMKWGLPFGWTVTQLAFNVVMFEDAMNSVDELTEGLELLKWGAGKPNQQYSDRKVRVWEYLTDNGSAKRGVYLVCT